MKKIWFLIALFAVVSCKKEAPIDYAILSGKIINKSESKLTLLSKDRYFKQEIKIDENGVFSDTVRVEPNAFNLNYGRTNIELYINVGDKINVSFDTEKTDSIVINGSQISQYLLEKNKIVKGIVGNGPEIYTKEETEYKETRLKIKDTISNLLNSTVNISEEFKAKELRSINYQYISDLDIYERYHAHYAKKKDFKVSEEFLANVEKVTDYNNTDDFLYSRGYKNIVNSYYRAEAESLVDKDSVTEDLAFLKAVSKAENDTIKNKLLFDDAKYGITYTESLEDYYQFFMDNSTNEEQKTEITKSYNKLKTVAKGQDSPKFVNFENFKGGTTSLDDLKGKYVYIDVWATWCGPCLREIPSLKELEKKYHGKNIEFVSISIDKAKDHDKWKKMVEEKELKGIQLFADKDWSSQFVKDYLIKGIPRFILIDTEGKIINSNAKRPSDPKLVEEINSLNI